MQRWFGFLLLLLAAMLMTSSVTFSQGNQSVYLPLAADGVLFRWEEGATRITGNANGNSWAAALDERGTRVVFVSDATNLAGTDGNGVSDIYLWERLTQRFRRVSVGLNGADANGGSYTPAISANGRYVVFASQASNLIADDTNNQEDVFRYDLQSGVMERVSEGGVNGGANGASDAPDISGDGRWVVFTSTATDMTMVPYPSDCSPGPCRTIFLRDMELGVTEVLVQNTDGTAAVPLSDPEISNDGWRVAYGWEQAANPYYGSGPMVYETFIYRYDRATATNELVSSARGNFTDGYCLMPYCGHIYQDSPILSGNGEVIGFGSDYYGSTQYGGSESRGIAVLGLGARRMAYDIRHDWNTNCPWDFQARMMPQGQPTYTDVALSLEGSVIAYAAEDLNIIGKDPSCDTFSYPYFADDNNALSDIYLLYQVGQPSIWETRRISSDEEGHPGNGVSYDVAISDDGYTIAYTTEADNVAGGNANGGVRDIVIWSRE